MTPKVAFLGLAYAGVSCTEHVLVERMTDLRGPFETPGKTERGRDSALESTNRS